MDPAMNSLLIKAMLFGFIPFCFVMFWIFPSRRAILFSLLIGWLFLPIASLSIPIPLLLFNKITSISLGIFLAAVCLDPKPMMAYRPRLVDLPMCLFCLSAFFSSIANGLGPKDGLAEMTNRMMEWGLIYFVGRCYMGDLPALRQLAVALLLAGLVYMPFCLLEIRLSPQFHNWVYGFYQHEFQQTIREGGAFRPMVFMQHGLAVAMFMACATLVGAWLWLTGALPRLLGMSTFWLTLALFITTVLCRSVGAFAADGGGAWRSLLSPLVAERGVSYFAFGRRSSLHGGTLHGRSGRQEAGRSYPHLDQSRAGRLGANACDQ